MKIYVGHAKKFDFKKELYEPLRNSSLNKNHDIVLPHEESDEPFNSKEFLKTCDVMIAEVTHRATGLGIELGWADYLGVPIICIYKKGAKPAGSLKSITNNFIEYFDEKEMISKLENKLKEFI